MLWRNVKSRSLWRQHLTIWAVIASAAAGLLPHVFFEFNHQLRKLNKMGSQAIDPRYAAATQLIPREEREIGYVTDASAVTMTGKTLFSHAQYAFAPHLVIATDKDPHVIVNLANPRRMDEICKSHGLRPVAILGGGVAIAVQSEAR
jgi:hypothetical protein